MSELVTLHGFTGRADDWARVVPSHRLALIGHSPELPVPAGHDFAAEVRRLAGRIAALATPIHLCGYSMGARLALAVALEQPAGIERLTLVGVHPGLADVAQRRARAARDAEWAALLVGSGIEAFVDAWERQPMWESQLAVSPAVRAAQREVRLAHDPSALAATLVATGLAAQPDLGKRLTELRIPTSFVAGALDPSFASLAADAALRAPLARAIVIAGAGHNPLIEQPAHLARIIKGDEP